LLSATSTKSLAYLTFEDVLSSSFYAGISDPLPSRPCLKFSSASKEALSMMKRLVEEKLAEDFLKVSFLA